MAGLQETCSRVLGDHLATALCPTVPPSGERTVVIVIAVALTDHLFKPRALAQSALRLNAADRTVKQAAPFDLRVTRRCGLIVSMPIAKKRDHQTEFRLLLESAKPVELPPAEASDSAVLVQFDKLKPYIPELLDALRAGTMAEPVAVMNDGSTFAIHGQTRTFWVKLWHSAGSELTKIERVQVISCLPSTRGTNVIIGDES